MMRPLRGAKPADPTPAPDKALARRFERRVALSRLALLAERVWEVLLWPFLVIGVFLVVSLFDLWGVLPPLLHRILLGAFGLALILSLLPLFRLPLPSRAEALRRLERTAQIKHRPASSYEDQLGGTTQDETALLWAAHRARLARLVAKLKPAWPAPRTDRKDPYALRSGLLILLAVAVLAAGGDSFERLRAAFSPAPRTAAALMRLDAWVTPPVYTGVAPIVLADGTEPVGSGAEMFRALSVPERSELIVRAHSPQGESVTLLAGPDDGSTPKPVAPKSTNSQGLVEFNAPLTLARQRRGAGRRQHGGEMALRPHQGRGPAYQPHGRPDGDAARRLAPQLPRRRRSWRGERRGEIRAGRRRGCGPRPRRPRPIKLPRPIH